MIKWGGVILVASLLSGCGWFMPTTQVSGHIPPSLTTPRIVHGCSEIQTELKLATCYLKTSEALYLANQDKESLMNLEKKWHN